jgi:hypothetical protein
MLSLHSKIIWLLSASCCLVYPSWADAHEATTVIVMNEEGFSPREVTVDEHTVINFVNKDSVDRWPASNLHPTHEVYPEFDPRQPITPGNFWMFRPNKPGIWRYHDHLWPHRRGTLTVTGEIPPPSTEQPWWQRMFTMLQNWREQFQKTRRLSDPSVQGVVDFTKLTAQEQYTYIHSLANHKGLAAAWQYIKNA